MNRLLSLTLVTCFLGCGAEAIQDPTTDDTAALGGEDDKADDAAAPARCKARIPRANLELPEQALEFEGLLSGLHAPPAENHTLILSRLVEGEDASQTYFYLVEVDVDERRIDRIFVGYSGLFEAATDLVARASSRGRIAGAAFATKPRPVPKPDPGDLMALSSRERRDIAERLISLALVVDGR